MGLFRAIRLNFVISAVAKQTFWPVLRGYRLPSLWVCPSWWSDDAEREYFYTNIWANLRAAGFNSLAGEIRYLNKLTRDATANACALFEEKGFDVSDSAAFIGGLLAEAVETCGIDRLASRTVRPDIRDAASFGWQDCGPVKGHPLTQMFYRILDVDGKTENVVLFLDFEAKFRLLSGDRKQVLACRSFRDLEDYLVASSASMRAP